MVCAISAAKVHNMEPASDVLSVDFGFPVGLASCYESLSLFITGLP
jgi:hypothetical protein